MRKYIYISLLTGLIIVGGWFLLQKVKLEYAFVPSDGQTVNREQMSSQIKMLSSKEEAGTNKQIELGKKLFFQETFGNEIFFTDILGMFNGPFTLGNVAKAIVKLRGEGTNNLQVEAAKDFHLGDIHIKKGDLIQTGLDVAKGSVTPLGVKIAFDEGRLKAGISCAVCHATVDNKGRVIEGLPNSDLNIGLTLAMGTNTAAYFSHTEMKNIKDYVKDLNRTVETSDGKKEALPDPKTFEQFVDMEIVKWPIGSNDTTIDFVNNPVQIPDSMTLGDHPYGWSGQGLIGPFKGLSAAINNAHAQNMDALSATEISGPVLKMDKEVYLGTSLQRAANPKYRYDYRSKEKPTEFFAKVDPTPKVAGVNRLIPAATFPRASFTTTVGLFSSSPGYDVWEQLNAMSAYMNSLQPIHTGLEKDREKYELGRKTFINAGCITCHGGTYLSSNEVIKSEKLKTEPARGKALKGHTKFFAEPSKYVDHTPVPLPDHPKTEPIKLTKEEREQLNIAWAMGNSNGGYKTISLYNLFWSAPYLHDGGVAVGPNMEMGVSNTLMKGKKADPYNSLKALLDPKLRGKVIESNAQSSKLRTAHITGEGHTFWVDESTGFTKEQQDALIHYLLTVTD